MKYFRSYRLDLYGFVGTVTKELVLFIFWLDCQFSILFCFK